MNESPFAGMPLCQHGYQFDCDRCWWITDPRTENRRMKWVLQSVYAPWNIDGKTLWDEYKEIDEEFWERQGL